MPGLSILGEQIELATLEEEESVLLMERILGSSVDRRDMYGWPQSIREALKLPLFAVMIGDLVTRRSRTGTFFAWPACGTTSCQIE